MIKLFIFPLIAIMLCMAGCSRTRLPISAEVSQSVESEEGCFLEGNVFTDESGYSMVWDHCVPKPSGESIYFVRYTDGPHEGKVYRVSQDTDGKSYITIDSKRIYF